MRIVRPRTRRLIASLVAYLLVTGAFVAIPATAHAAPSCQEYLVIDARGTGQNLHPWADETYDFFRHVNYALGRGNNFDNVVQLGDLNGTNTGSKPQHPDTEYPAVGVEELYNYGASVKTGADEFVNFLNTRAITCPQEVKIAGGFSQGADALGWAVERDGGGGFVSLTPQARRQLGYVALYGDVKNNSGPVANSIYGIHPWWARGSSNGYESHWCDGSCPYGSVNNGVQFYTANQGLFGARSPVYAREDLQGRFGSWCDEADNWCNIQGAPTPGAHNAYKGDYGWMWKSAAEIANAARLKRNELTNGPTDPNHDGHPDLMVVPFVGTGSGKTEVNALEGHGFGSWLYNLPSGEGSKASRNAYHLFADYNGDRVTDLYEISMSPYGSTDVHVKAGPNYTASLGDWVTPIQGQSPYTAKAALADKDGDGKAELYVFTSTNYKVDVHVLDGNSFHDSRGDFATPAGITTMNDYEMLVGDYNHDGTPDMYLVSLKGGGTKADVHVLSGAGGFQNWLGHWPTPFGACDVNHARAMLGDYNHDGQPDVYFGVYKNSENKIDVHVLDGHSFNGYIGSWPTIAGAGSFATTDLALAA